MWPLASCTSWWASQSSGPSSTWWCSASWLWTARMNGGMLRSGLRLLATGTAWSSTSRTNRCRGVGGDASRSDRRWLICNQSAPVCTTTHMSSAALEEGWEAWAVPSPIRTHSAPSWILISTFTQFPTRSRRSRPAPWRTASSPHPWARCLRAYTASQTITSSWGEGNPFKTLTWTGQITFHVFYTRSNISNAAPCLILFQHFPLLLFLFLCNIKKYSLEQMKNTTREQQAWTQWNAKHEAWMSIFSRDCFIYTNCKTFLKSDLRYKINIITLVSYQMMHTWGNAIFQKGSMLVSP